MSILRLRRSGDGGRSPRFMLLVGYVIVTFLIGGSQRADVQSLAILRPLAALLCGYGIWALTREQFARYAVLYWLLGAAIGLCLLHLVPLPPLLWHALPGRGIVADIDRAVDLSGQWRPLALVPWAARNALFSLLVPLAALLLASGLDRREREALLPLLIGIGLGSGFLGLLQTLGPVDGPLYLYDNASGGFAVGLFANRNHGAVFLVCLFPMLAAFASQHVASAPRARFRLWLSIAAGFIIVPMLIASGSRAALLIALPALASVLLVYHRPSIEGRRPSGRRRHTRTLRAYVIATTVVAALILIVLMLARTDVLDRFMLLGVGDDLRFRVWGGIVADTWRFLPVGSGAGSFAQVYQIHEPDGLLRPTYLNHAHNDPLEVVMTTGLPGLLLMGAAVIGWTRGAYNVWGKKNDEVGIALARMASVVLFILFVASMADYPVRTPSLACLGIIAALWLVAGVDRSSRDDRAAGAPD